MFSEILIKNFPEFFEKFFFKFSEILKKFSEFRIKKKFFQVLQFPPPVKVTSDGPYKSQKEGGRKINGPTYNTNALDSSVNDRTVSVLPCKYNLVIDASYVRGRCPPLSR